MGDVKMGWDAKRDRWNGYDSKEYKAVTDEYAELEALKQAQAKKDEEDDEGEDGAKYAEESDMGRHQSTSTKQLRIREDTAKYLLNLDLDSAKYDPKTRSMVDSGATADTAAALVAEEGFMRASGDAAEFEKAQKYAWESQEKVGDTKLHLQANPTSGEYYRRKEKEEAEAKRQAHKKMLLEKYGGETNSNASKLRDAAVVESERYLEYDESGAIKGTPKVSSKSKYQADVLRTGGRFGGSEPEPEFDPPKEIAWQSKDVNEKPKDESTSTLLAKKRTAEEMKGGVSEEAMENYRRKRTAANDPMASFLGKDELLP